MFSAYYCRSEEMKTKAAIFDFDGTLFNLNVDWKSLKKEIQKIAGLRDMSSGFFESIVSLDNESMQKRLYELITEREIEGIDEGQVMQGMEKLLQHLDKKNIRTGIISRNSRKAIEKAINNFSLGTHEFIIGREDVKNLKPHPEAMSKALTYLNMVPKDIIYIGDSEMIDGTFSRVSGVKFFDISKGWDDVWKFF
jgi:phosphoglycolate phosphatase